METALRRMFGCQLPFGIPRLKILGLIWLFSITLICARALQPELGHIRGQFSLFPKSLWLVFYSFHSFIFRSPMCDPLSLSRFLFCSLALSEQCLSRDYMNGFLAGVRQQATSRTAGGSACSMRSPVWLALPASIAAGPPSVRQALAYKSAIQIGVTA